MAYIKLADTAFGELGHNGWTYVLSNPYPVEDTSHAAYYEETGVLTVDAAGRDYAVSFRELLSTSRGGIAPRPSMLLPISNEMAAAARANRAAHDAAHMPVGGWRSITD